MTAPTQDMEDAGIDEYFPQDGVLDDSLNDAGVDELLGSGAGAKGGGDPARHIAPIPGGGVLLEERDWRKVYRTLTDIIQRQERLAKNREQEELHLKRIVRGVPFSYLQKDQDRSVYRAVLPPFVQDVQQPVPNKVADLRKKIISQMTADDFLPNPKADGDTDKDRGAADITKKFLRADGTGAGTNDKQMLRECLNINMVGKSAFQFGWIDKTGGGWRPMQVKAHPLAEDPQRPMFGPKVDPQTGQPMVGADGKPLMIERASNPVLRYVAEIDDPEGVPDPTTGEVPKKQVFTDDAAAAARQWQPKIRRTTIYPAQVRMVPITATAPEASQIIVLMWEPLGEAKKRFPILAELGPEQLRQVCDWRPSWWKSVVPEKLKTAVRATDTGSGRRCTDDTIMFWVHSFCRIGGDYVDGGEIAVSGANGGMGLKRETLREDVKLDDGTSAPVLMDPPIAQFICLQDADEGDPFGYGFIRDFEGGNEAYAQIWVGMLEAIDVALHRNTMIPATSPITGAEWRRRDGTPLEIMTPEDAPRYEEPPQVPQFVPQMLDMIERVMNTEAQTNETSNGLDSQYSVSGIAKDIAIKQARVGLAQYWQNTVNGLLQWWRIKTQLAKAYYTVPQQVKLSGIESAYKQPWWIGPDLMGVSDIALEPGSGTMMNPQEKVGLMTTMVQAQFIDPEQAAEVARSAMTDDLGLPPNIHEEHANRCIAAWAEGIPPGWADIKQRNDAKRQQHQRAILQQVALLVSQGLDEGTATQRAQQMVPPPQLEPLPTPFDDRPNDEDPAVALIHYRRLNRFASTAEYSKHEPEWRQVFDERFALMRQRAGVQTVAEKQQADQQGAMDQRYQQFIQTIDKKVNAMVEQEIAKVVSGSLGAEQEATASQAAQRELATAEAERQRQHDAVQKEKDREHKAELHARDVMSKEAIAAHRASRPVQPATRPLATRGQ